MILFAISVYDFLNFSVVVFMVGLWGLLVSRSNFLITLMSIEIMIFSVNINLIAFSVYFDDLSGQIFALFILGVAAAESALGLAIVVSYYRLRGLIALDALSSLKG